MKIILSYPYYDCHFKLVFVFRIKIIVLMTKFSPDKNFINLKVINRIKGTIYTQTLADTI